MLAFLVGAGSFTTFRRRRLASPTSIVRIEATHPLVNVAPVRVGGRDHSRVLIRLRDRNRPRNLLRKDPGSYTLISSIRNRSQEDAPPPALQPARTRRARMPHGTADASVRDGRDHAQSRPGREHPPQLRLALLGGRRARAPRADRAPRDRARRAAAGAHRVPDHRRGAGRGHRLARRAARHERQGISQVRSGPGADGRAATGARRGVAARGVSSSSSSRRCAWNRS